MIARIDWKTKVMRGEADRRITDILKISMEFSVRLILGLVSTFI